MIKKEMIVLGESICTYVIIFMCNMFILCMLYDIGNINIQQMPLAYSY